LPAEALERVPVSVRVGVLELEREPTAAS
jgi:hypothetical protein